MVDGRIVVEGGKLVHADLAALIREANAITPGLLARRAAWLAESSGAVRRAAQ